MDKESWIGKRRSRWMGMSYYGPRTVYANTLIGRAILNKCNSYILDYVYSRSVLLSSVLVHLGFHSIKQWRIYLSCYIPPLAISFYKINTIRSKKSLRANAGCYCNYVLLYVCNNWNRFTSWIINPDLYDKRVFNIAWIDTSISIIIYVIIQLLWNVIAITSSVDSQRLFNLYWFNSLEPI